MGRRGGVSVPCGSKRGIEPDRAGLAVLALVAALLGCGDPDDLVGATPDAQVADLSAPFDQTQGPDSPPDAGWTAQPIDSAPDFDLFVAADGGVEGDGGLPDVLAADATPVADAMDAVDLVADSAEAQEVAEPAAEAGGADTADELDAGAPDAADAAPAEIAADGLDSAPEADAQLDAAADDLLQAETVPDAAAEGVSETNAGSDSEDGDASDSKPEVIDPNKCPYGLSPKTLCLKWGVCASGVVLGCVGNSPVCDYSGVAGYEEVEKSCDGLDNDCNQLVDDELPMPALLTAKGVCASQKPTCAGAKGWIVSDYASLPAYQTVETACDGLDNDCDGKTDQFVSAPPLSPKPGVCGLALQLCAGKQGWIDPSVTQVVGYQPLESLCDGKDNDCDGQTDENLAKANPPGSGLGKPSLGVCAGALLQCKGGQWVAPDYAAWSALATGGTPTFEETETTCDGLDNDCNGIADDVATPAPPASKTQGVCAGLVKQCAAAKGWQDPDFSAIAGYGSGSEVVCDGQDNDCDGKTDEDAACPRWQIGGKGNGRLALSPDGAQLAWLSATGVHVHNLLTGAHAYDHFGHRFGVEAVAFSPDGTRIASVGKIDALRVYYAAYGLGKPASWPLVLALGKATDHFTAVAWTADAKTVVVGTDKGAVFALDVQSGAAVASWAPHAKAVRAVAVHPKAAGGLGVLSGGDDGKVAHMAGAAAPAQVLASFGSPVRHLHYDAASHRVVAAADQLAPRVLDVASGSAVAILGGLADCAGVRLAAAATSAQAVTAAGQLWQWPLPAAGLGAPPVVQPKLVAEAPATGAPDTAVDFAVGPTATYVGFVARGPARLTLGPPKWAWPVARHQGAVFDLAAEQGTLWSAGQSGTVGAWALATGQPGGLFVLHEGDVLTLAIASEPNQSPRLVTAATDYSVRVWQLNAGQAAATLLNLKTFGLGGPWARDLAIVPGAGSFWAAAGAGAHRLGLGPTTLGQKLQVYAVGLGATVRKVAVSPDGQWLALALDGLGPANGDQLRLVSAATLQTIWQRKDLGADEAAIAFRPQGDLLAVGGGAAGLAIVDVKTGENAALLFGHSGTVRALDWTADGARLLSTSNDGTARVWAIAPGKAPVSLVSMTRHCPGNCTNVAVTAGIWGDAGGTYAVTASDDGAIIGWDAPAAP